MRSVTLGSGDSVLGQQIWRRRLGRATNACGHVFSSAWRSMPDQGRPRAGACRGGPWKGYRVSDDCSENVMTPNGGPPRWGRPAFGVQWPGLEATRAGGLEVKQHNHDTLEVSTRSSKSSFGECFAMFMGRHPRICDAWTARLRRRHVRQGLGMVRHTDNRWGDHRGRTVRPSFKRACAALIQCGSLPASCRLNAVRRLGSSKLSSREARSNSSRASASTSTSVKPWLSSPDKCRE